MKNLLKISFILLLSTLMYQDSIAQTKLSVQGVIRLSDGNAIEDGVYPITFKLYDAESGGTELWTETQSQLKVTSGIYSAILGEVNPLDLEFDAFYYLSLTVEGEELLPRAPLTSAPYSNSVLGFENVFPSTGDVGIGTLNPSKKLSVVGGIEANSLEVDTLDVTEVIYAKRIYTQYRGSYVFGAFGNPEVPQGVSTLTIPTPTTMPSIMVGHSNSIVHVVCSETGCGQPGISILRAWVKSPTEIEIVVKSDYPGGACYKRVNWVVFPNFQ